MPSRSFMIGRELGRVMYKEAAGPAESFGRSLENMGKTPPSAVGRAVDRSVGGVGRSALGAGKAVAEAPRALGNAGLRTGYAAGRAGQQVAGGLADAPMRSGNYLGQIGGNLWNAANGRATPGASMAPRGQYGSAFAAELGGGPAAAKQMPRPAAQPAVKPPAPANFGGFTNSAFPAGTAAPSTPRPAAAAPQAAPASSIKPMQAVYTSKLNPTAQAAPTPARTSVAGNMGRTLGATSQILGASLIPGYGSANQDAIAKALPDGWGGSAAAKMAPGLPAPSNGQPTTSPTYAQPPGRDFFNPRGRAQGQATQAAVSDDAVYRKTLQQMQTKPDSAAGYLQNSNRVGAQAAGQAAGRQFAGSLGAAPAPQAAPAAQPSPYGRNPMMQSTSMQPGMSQIPAELMQRYQANRAAGRTKMTPAEALGYYNQYYGGSGTKNIGQQPDGRHY